MNRSAVAHNPDTYRKAESSIISITRGTQRTLGTLGGPEDQFWKRQQPPHFSSLPCFVSYSAFLYVVYF